MRNAVTILMLLGLLALGPALFAEAPSSSHAPDVAPASGEESGDGPAFAESPDWAAPEPISASGCSASFSCGDGNTASCTGSYSCVSAPLAVPSYVECDGNRYYCPNMCYVNVFCAPNNWIQCSSNVGDCQEGLDWVRCDGETFQCGMRGGPD